MAKKRVEKLNDAFPDFVDEADLSLDRILDSITASNLPIPDENAAAPHSDINSFDSFYQNKISETCDDILMLEKNAATRHRTGNFVKMTVEICLQPCYNTLESSKNQEEVRFGNEKKNRYSDQRR